MGQEIWFLMRISYKPKNKEVLDPIVLEDQVMVNDSVCIKREKEKRKKWFSVFNYLFYFLSHGYMSKWQKNKYSLVRSGASMMVGFYSGRASMTGGCQLVSLTVTVVW